MCDLMLLYAIAYSQNDMNMQALQSMTAKCMEIEDELGKRMGECTQVVVGSSGRVTIPVTRMQEVW